MSGRIAGRRGFVAVIAGLILESMPVGAVGIIGLTAAGVMGYVEHDPNKSRRWMSITTLTMLCLYSPGCC